MTFAFVDVVESTKTFAEHGSAFVAALAVLQERVARHTHASGGSVVKTEGDGAFLVFPAAAAAVEALVGLQGELDQVPAGPGPRLAIRAGAHTGDAEPVAGDYVALAVNVAARVTSTAGAGQVVVTAATQVDLVAPVGVCLGDYDLKDIADPVELWRVCGDETPLRAPPARRTNVRIPTTGFVGRDKELADLSDLVANHRVVTVLGPGGLGKTRLVSELVLQIAGGIPGGAWLIELASLSAADQVPAAVGQALGVQGGGIDAIAAEVRRRGEVLLVLDNCEHLIDPVADLVVDLRDACPELTVLTTSREPLQVPGEVVRRLSPLTERAARVELFTQRAWASGATVADGSVEVVDRLCAALDGLPLAIELAATQAGSASLLELIRIAEHGTDDLARRGGPARQRSLAAVLSWSLDRLPPARRASLLVLSVLPGRFDLGMATTILGAVDPCEVDAVRPLARASLIDLDGETYRILDTIRHAARRQLSRDPELAAAARLGLRRWAQQLAEDEYRTRLPLDDVPTDRDLALEIALEDAVDDGATGIGKLWELVRANSFYREPSERIRILAKRVLSGPLPTDPDEDLCFNGALNILALTRALESLPVSDARLEAICDAADSHGVSIGSGYLHFNVGFHHALRGELALARKHADGYLRFAASQVADSVDRGYAHNLWGLIAQADGAWDVALFHAERELEGARAAGNPVGLGISEGNFAEALLDAGRPDEALVHAVDAVRRIARSGPVRRYALRQLVRARLQAGDTDAGAATVRELEAELLASGRPQALIEAELDEIRQRVAALTSGSPTPRGGA